jgi:hypothetical protein
MTALFALSFLSQPAAAEPPEGVDRDDLERWEAMSQDAIDGPDGCWDLSGNLLVAGGLLSKASFWRRTSETPYEYRGTWRGRLEDGVWTTFAYAVTDQVVKGGEPVDVPIYPVVGEIDASIVVNESAEPDPEERQGGSITVEDGGDGSSPTSLLRESIEGWDTSTAFAYGRWNDETRAIELIQETPISDDANSATIDVTTYIPNGEWVSRVSVMFPRKLVLGEWPLKVRLHDTQFHLVQQQVSGRVFPSAENISTVGTALGFTVSYEQRLDYLSATPCVSEPDAPEEPAEAADSKAEPAESPAE